MESWKICQNVAGQFQIWPCKLFITRDGKNLSMALLVSRDKDKFRQIIELYMSRDISRPMESFFPSRVIKSLQGPIQKLTSYILTIFFMVNYFEIEIECTAITWR